MPKCYRVSVFTKDEAYLRFVSSDLQSEDVTDHEISLTQFHIAFYGKSQVNYSVYGLRTKYLIRDLEL